MHTHMGISFEVWNGGQAWFWMVDDPRGRRAAIGAVADEMGAIREAHSSIEEMSARRAPADEPAGAGNRARQSPVLRSTLDAAATRWKQMLANLDRHLASVCAEGARI